MNEIARFPTLERVERGAPLNRTAEPALLPHHQAGRHRAGWLLGASVALVLTGGLGYGAWRDYTQRQEVAAAAQHQRDYVPDVLVGQVRASGATTDVSLPGTTFAYEVANIYARANG